MSKTRIVLVTVMLLLILGLFSLQIYFDLQVRKEFRNEITEIEVLKQFLLQTFPKEVETFNLKYIPKK